ncbi:ABC transporter permease [Streptomyces sp. SPB074]|uniref:ABC transporter permease n=1 Tax=Streptomyces sp. (strain SPB074) TaxID=465543 RepID=UPI00017F11E0|nr:ABC transporter permease [Streptomyces sp. SPB074]EDY42516.1 daunorubicin resistance transmembrane protein [Streptomyces sp. SPB074]
MTIAPGTVPAQGTPHDALRKALTSQIRPSHPKALTAVRVSAWRTMRKMKHYGVAVLFDVTLMPIVFLLTFTYLFGGAFAGSAKEYLQYFLPGVLVQTVVMPTVYTGTALNMDITRGIHDRFRTLPFWQPATIVGNLLGDIVRYVLALTTTMAVGLALGFRPDGGVGGVLAAMLLLLLFALSVSWIFAALGVVAKAPETVSGSSMLVMFPLVFTSNIFVEPDTMPGWMEAIVKVNPVSNAATAARGLIHGDASGTDIGWVLLACAIITVIFAPLTMYLYRAKSRG